jgi:SpoVK/Ycf46/Vps4 family AAA+-type ATPase
VHVHNPYARPPKAAPPAPPPAQVPFSYTPPDEMSTESRFGGLPPPHNQRYNSAPSQVATSHASYPADSGTTHVQAAAPPDYSAAWEDYQRQNPFQTAREFSAVEQETRRQQAPPRQQQLPPPPPPPPQQQPTSQRGGGGGAPLNNPYQPPPTKQPVIPESLRRKYRPPVKPTGTKSGHAQQQQQQKNPNHHHKTDEEEDDLPEALQRFGKELVQKIENEIMDGGDPITFDDIAGLHEAKQTIQEVICWPMKRPDLFTGLRRAPNGLLLYGPPGKYSMHTDAFSVCRTEYM